MKNYFRYFSFPYKTPVLIISALLIFSPIFITGFFFSSPESFLNNSSLVRTWWIISSLLSCIGFIYCILGYHFKTLYGDELKLKIHLESLNIAFTTILVSFFVLIFSFLNFWPTGLNWILIFLAVIGILTYVIAVEFVKDTYK